MSPTPTYDPLAEPMLPENPSPAEFGKYLYYYHCMPCHGDLGQGLTDEFRQVWVEDHQNCWNRGCHGGRPKDEGFPIPTYVPGVIAETDALAGFQRFESLLTYLHDTHPPQYPGKLTDEEYQAITAYLWLANQKPTQAAETPTDLPSTETPTPKATLTNTPIPTATATIIEIPPSLTVIPPAPNPESRVEISWVIAGFLAGSLALFSLLAWIKKR